MGWSFVYKSGTDVQTILQPPNTETLRPRNTNTTLDAVRALPRWQLFKLLPIFRRTTRKTYLSTMTPGRTQTDDAFRTSLEAQALPRKKLTGRAFYESLGSPKLILAPMVDQSEFVRFSLLPQSPSNTDARMPRRGACSHAHS